MGMVIVILSAPFPANATPTWEQYDALPDPLGWLLVILGMVALARVDDSFSTSRWLAVLAGVVSVPMWFPQLHHQLDDSGDWFASLPQLAFCLVLAREIGLLGATQTPADGYVAKRFGLLVWGFGVLAVLPVLTLGGGLDPARGSDGAARDAGERRRSCTSCSGCIDASGSAARGRSRSIPDGVPRSTKAAHPRAEGDGLARVTVSVRRRRR